MPREILTDGHFPVSFGSVCWAVTEVQLIIETSSWCQNRNQNRQQDNTYSENMSIVYIYMVCTWSISLLKFLIQCLRWLPNLGGTHSDGRVMMKAHSPGKFYTRIGEWASVCFPGGIINYYSVSGILSLQSESHRNRHDRPRVSSWHPERSNITPEAPRCGHIDENTWAALPPRCRSFVWIAVNQR